MQHGGVDLHPDTERPNDKPYTRVPPGWWGQIPLTEQFSFEPQFQLGLQGNSGNGNPFAYAHALQFRPWIHYDGIPNVTVTGAMSYIYYFTVPGTSYYRHPEWRFTVFGTLKQCLKGGSLYEQLRFELLNFRASNGDVQHLPRVRIRFGQNFYISERPSKPYLGIYEEALVQFPKPPYSIVHFQGPGSLPATVSITPRE
jgi:hypothetical protein